MSENVGFAGQIGPEHVTQVVEKGFKSIINNRPDMEGVPSSRPVHKSRKLHAMPVWIMYSSQ